MGRPASAPMQPPKLPDALPPPPAGSRAPTPFEARLYEACAQVPAGRVTTYGALAELLGSSPRAVGQALRRNPFAPKVPCHRVVAAGGSLGGFNGAKSADSPQLKKKCAMLAAEGVKFDGRRVSPECVLSGAALRRAVASTGRAAGS
uniref:Methylated-DNA--protein-cysteine methyltransferase n=1 Tax=Tetraselmis sp. GSL018 TaxID=582737 RepID=A0A061R3A8_9CHLO|mmetsp:Transcript_25216/g.60017  ORF Transcript_25216/g.60017 Transcript_25216/m.60017 type:complete len:147 (+) Transcript_25216:38-478(+)